MDKKLRLSLIFQAAGNATTFLRGVKGESTKAGQALMTARQRVNQLQAAARDVAGLRKLETQLSGTRQTLAAAQQEAQRLGRAHAGAERPTKALAAALAVARTKVNELKDAEQRQALALQTVRQRLDAAGVSTKRLGAAEAILANDTRRANEELAEQQRRLDGVNERQRRMGAARGRYDRTQQLAGTMQGSGMSAIGAGAAVGAPLVLASRQAMGFEDAMADVRKVVDFPTPRAFRQMSNEILAMSERLPVAKEELAGIMAQGARAGVARNQLLAYTEAAAKMGVAFDVSSEEAGAMMATWRTALGLDQSGVIALADRVNALTNAYGGNAAAVSDMVTRVGPLGDIAGASGPSLAALAQVMNSVGVESEIGATGIKNLLLGLTKGEAATKSQRAAFKALGMDASQMARRMQTDSEGAIMSVLDAVAKLPKERGLAVLSQLFGTESVAAIAPLLSQLDLVRRNFKDVGNAAFYAGSMDKEYAARAATTANAVALAKNSVSALAVEIGTTLLPAIKAGSEWMKGAARQVRDFSAAHPGAVKVVAALVGILAAGLLVFGGIAVVIAAVLGPFALLQLALTQTGLLFGPVIAGLTGTGAAAGGAAVGVNALLWPVLLVVAAVAALAVAGYLIYRNWGKIGPWLNRLWSGVTQTVGAAFGFLKNLFLTFHPLGIVIRNWGAITGFMRALWTMLGQLVGLGVDSVLYLLMRFTPLGIIVRNWSGITGVVSRVWSSVRGAVAGGIAAVRSAIANFAPLQDFITAFQGVFNWFTGLPGRFLQIGTDIVNGLTRGIRGGRANVQAATRDVAGAAEAGARRRLDTHSPSRIFAAIGGDVMAGFSQGIRGGAGGPVDRMRAAAAAIAAAGVVSVPGMAFAGAPPGAAPFATAEGSRLAAPSLTPGLRMPAAAAGAGQRAPSPGPVKVEIHIHAAAGQSEERIAQMVDDKLREFFGSSGRARLGDDNTSWGDD